MPVSVAGAAIELDEKSDDDDKSSPEYPDSCRLDTELSKQRRVLSICKIHASRCAKTATGDGASDDAKFYRSGSESIQQSGALHRKRRSQKTFVRRHRWRASGRSARRSAEDVGLTPHAQ